jgi:MscS family membrane protein
MISLKYVYLLLAIVGIGISRLFLKTMLEFITRRTKTELDNKIVRHIFNPLWLMIVLVLIEHATYLFYQSSTLQVIFKSLEVLVGAWLSINFIKPFLEYIEGSPYAEEKMVRTAINVLHNIVSIIIFFIAFLILLSLWKINITPILASVGLASIALGFALKDIVENVLSGILIFLDPPFKVGDIVDIGGEELGEVVDIGIRNTKIKTFDNRIVTIPNSEVLKSKIINYNLPDDIIRVTVKIGVSYDTDPDYVKKVVMEDVLSKIEEILPSPKPQVLFVEFGDSALLFEIRFWVNIADRFTATDKVNTLIWKVFKEKKIEIPFPIRTVYLRKEG